MENIIEPNNNFDFTKLSLAHPTGIQGGAYFTKLLCNNKPLYIQTTKSLTRQGLVKSGKKYYCDLMFDNNSEILINWFENLETTCQNLIFEKSEAWFQNSLDKNDVESAFNSVIRIYKSGKYYLVRTNVKVNSNNEPAIKIYNENETPLTIDDINQDTNIISILEIQGIKFTSRNFQIEIELRQSMVLDNEPLFDNCVIKTTNSKATQYVDHNNLFLNNNISTTITNTLDNEIDANNVSLEETKNMNVFSENNTIIEEIIIDNENNNENVNNKNDKINSDNLENVAYIDNIDDKVSTQEEVIDLRIEELGEDESEDNKELLKELDLDICLANDLEDNTDTIKLKKPNQVYYELYKQAREKAKQAKKAAIIAYLEAKNIRKTYMLDTLNEDEDESDIDAEIDEVSESELDEL
jgi:hypothetical protein